MSEAIDVARIIFYVEREKRDNIQNLKRKERGKKREIGFKKRVSYVYGAILSKV